MGESNKGNLNPKEEEGSFLEILYIADILFLIASLVGVVSSYCLYKEVPMFFKVSLVVSGLLIFFLRFLVDFTSPPSRK